MEKQKMALIISRIARLRSVIQHSIEGCPILHLGADVGAKLTGSFSTKLLHLLNGDEYEKSLET
jgi:hypothetical protein